MNKLFLGMVAAAVLLSCSGEKKIDPNLEKLGRATGPTTNERPVMPPPGMGTPDQGAQDASDKPLYAGVAAEIINVPNYTYIKIRGDDGEEVWSAVPKCGVKEGTRVKVRQSLVMTDFTSPSLGRTFASVIFGVLEDAPPNAADEVDGGPKPSPPPAAGKSLPEGHPPIE